MGGGFKTPYTFNPAGFADGPLPSPWIGSTFAISSGVVINTPTVGPTELLTDPGLEAAYTAGLCDTLTKNGTPTVADGAPDVHGGSHAQSFDATAVNQWLRYPLVAAVVNTWYLASCWEKMTAGSASNDFTGKFTLTGAYPASGAGFGWLLNDAAWTQNKVSFVASAVQNINFFPAWNFAAGVHTAIVDDGSLKIITYATLWAMLPSVSRMAIVKAQPSTIVDGTITGLVAWGSAQASPTTYLMATINRRYNETLLEIGLMKCVAGTFTQLINPTATAQVANAWLEIRPVDNDTVGLYYNNVQIGANQDVADVPGGYPGMVITGGNTLKGFFVG